MKLKLALCFFLFFYWLPTKAQDTTVLSAASPSWNLLASNPKGEFDTLKIPIKRVDNLILIEAEVDGIRGNFIFDTGAPGLVLNTSYFRDKAIKKNRASVGIAGSNAVVLETQIKRLQISSLYYENILVELTELSHIENSKGVKIIGLLGNALFEDLIFKIDLRKSYISIIKHNKQKKAEEKLGISLAFSYINNSMVFPMKIENKNINVLFDSGAEVMVLDNYLPQSIMKNVQLNKRINLKGTGGQKLEVWSGLLKEIQFEKNKWSNVPVIISGLQELSEAYGQEIDAIMGNYLFEKGIVEVNIRKRLITLYIYKENQNE